MRWNRNWWAINPTKSRGERIQNMRSSQRLNAPPFRPRAAGKPAIPLNQVLRHLSHANYCITSWPWGDGKRLIALRCRVAVNFGASGRGWWALYGLGWWINSCCWGYRAGYNAVVVFRCPPGCVISVESLDIPLLNPSCTSCPVAFQRGWWGWERSGVNLIQRCTTNKLWYSERKLNFCSALLELSAPQASNAQISCWAYGGDSR